MWRTSWLSREVIVLPAFIALVALWWLAAREPVSTPTRLALPLAAIAVAALLWYCTAMIYACLRFIEEWAQPLTIVNFILLGLSSGSVLASALAALASETARSRSRRRWRSSSRSSPGRRASRRGAATRPCAIARPCRARPASASARLAQTSMGMSAGSFNTREFFHRASAAALRRIKRHRDRARLRVACVAAGGVAVGALPDLACVAALVVQAPGLIADRWLFFAQAKHPQNLYYQVVS